MTASRLSTSFSLQLQTFYLSCLVPRAVALTSPEPELRTLLFAKRLLRIKHCTTRTSFWEAFYACYIASNSSSQYWSTKRPQGTASSVWQFRALFASGPSGKGVDIEDFVLSYAKKKWEITRRIRGKQGKNAPISANRENVIIGDGKEVPLSASSLSDSEEKY